MLSRSRRTIRPKARHKRVVIGHTPLAQLAAPVRRVAQEGLDTAVALLLVFAKDQAREELRQGEVPSAEPAAVRWQAAAGQFVGHAHHLVGALAGEHPAACNRFAAIAPRPICSVRAGSRQSPSTLFPVAGVSFVLRCHRLHGQSRM